MIPTPFSHKRKQFKIEFYKNQKLVCKCHFHITTSQNNKCAIIIQKSSLGLHPNKHDTYSHNFGLQVAHFWLVTISLRVTRSSDYTGIPPPTLQIPFWQYQGRSSRPCSVTSTTFKVTWLFLWQSIGRSCRSNAESSRKHRVSISTPFVCICYNINTLFRFSKMF